MKFWDASAIVPLLVVEPKTTAMLEILEQDPVVLVWWGTPVECNSAPSNVLRGVAERLLRVHALRAADSLQLAAAIIGAEQDPATLELVSLDERLNSAATREGFRIVTG